MMFLLCACAASKEEFFNVTYNGNSFVVGYDFKELIENSQFEKIETKKDKKENEIVIYVSFYVEEGKDITIDDVIISDGIKENCNTYDGVLINKNGYACYISKRVNGRENYIILHGDLLNDDINKINRVEVGYDMKESD